jgi:hypothetical protein
MWQMVRNKDEISAGVGGFSVHFGGHYNLFPEDQIIQ